MKRWLGIVIFIVISFTSRFALASIREPEINGCEAVIGANSGIAMVLPPPGTSKEGVRVLVAKSRTTCKGGVAVAVMVENTGRTSVALPTELSSPSGAVGRVGATRERASCVVLEIFSARHEHGRNSLPGPSIATFVGCEGDQLRTVPPHGKISYVIRSTFVGPLVFGAQLLRSDVRFDSGVTALTSTRIGGVSTSHLIRLNKQTAVGRIDVHAKSRPLHTEKFVIVAANKFADHKNLHTFCRPG